MTCTVYKINKTKDPVQLLKLLKEFEGGESPRYKLAHTEWEKNALFWMGKQWLEPRSGTDGFDILQEDDEHYRPVTNYVARICDLKRSQIAGKLIRSVVRPNTLSNKKDIDSARLADLCLRALSQRDGEDALDTLVLLHAQIFGIAWRADYKTPVPFQFYNVPVSEEVKTPSFSCEDCGTKQDVPQAECAQCGGSNIRYTENSEHVQAMGPDGMPVTQQLPMFTTIAEVVDPFRIKVSKSAVEKQIRWILDSSIQPVDWVKENHSATAPGYIGPEAANKVKKRDGIPRALKISEDFKNSVTLANSSVEV